MFPLDINISFRPVYSTATPVIRTLNWTGPSGGRIEGGALSKLSLGTSLKTIIRCFGPVAQKECTVDPR